MRIITGRITQLLHNSADEVTGLLLDNGPHVHFSPDQASAILAIVTAGSLVEIRASSESSGGVSQLHVVVITNLDSKSTATIHAHTPPQCPEVSSDVRPSPGTATPLAPALQNLSRSHEVRDAALQPLATRDTVAEEIERAYDGLHRAEVMLAYLKMVSREKSAIGQYLDEAKHTYVQALSRYEGRDFEGAREFAAASNGLSLLIEILISKSYHSTARYPTLVSVPTRQAPARAIGATQHDLDRIGRCLTRIHWVTENGTLPARDRAQVNKLSSWGETLHGWACRLLEAGALEDANQFAQAANAAACSAEHLCRRCYVTCGAPSFAAAQ